jgi:hypothetical protein
MYIWISGSEIALVGTNSGNPQFRITYDGSVARWYINSTLVYSYTSNITSPLYFATNVGASPYEYYNVQFGPAIIGPTGAGGGASALTIVEQTGTSQTLSSSNYNTFFYLTNPGFNAVSLPASTATSAGGNYWALRNATSSYLSITLTNTLSLTSPLVIPPTNTQTLAISGATSNTILLL